MPDPTSHLAAMFDLDRLDADRFRVDNGGEGGRRLFGGQVASQALRAAASTVDAGHQVNSLHAYFLRPGRYGVPITFTVDRIRDGSSFTTRRVVASQADEAILNLDASFHGEEEGSAYQSPSPIDGLPDPEGLPAEPDRMGPHQRFVDRRPVELPGAPDTVRARWVRTKEQLGEDPVVHACAITFLSDSGPAGVARRAIGGPEGGGWAQSMMTASLDHCVWFHRPARADDWLLYRLEPVVADRSRGLARGELWTRSGELVVTITQESLLRWRR